MESTISESPERAALQEALRLEQEALRAAQSAAMEAAHRVRQSILALEALPVPVEPDKPEPDVIPSQSED